MQCPLCQTRSARRQCPALGRGICAVCCGTKRRTEIRCPGSCPYLANAESHPPAAVRRQQAQDVSLLIPALAGLSEPQQQLFLFTVTLVDRFRGDGLDALTDADVADAAAALAGTYETAASGIIYEHRAGTSPAQRLATEIRTVFDDLGRTKPGAFAADAALVLRRLADRVADVHKAGLDTTQGFLTLAARVAAQFGSPSPAGDAADPPPSSIILP